MANPTSTFRKIAVTTAGLALSAAGVFCVLLLEGRLARAEAPQQAPAEPSPRAAPAEAAPRAAATPPAPPPDDTVKRGIKRAARKVVRPVRGY